MSIMEIHQLDIKKTILSRPTLETYQVFSYKGVPLPTRFNEEISETALVDRDTYKVLKYFNGISKKTAYLSIKEDDQDMINGIIHASAQEIEDKITKRVLEARRAQIHTIKQLHWWKRLFNPI